MHTVKLSAKRQITLPVSMCRQLEIKEGDHVIIEVIENRIMIMKTPESMTDYFSGIAKGVFGKTAEEVDAYIDEERKSWE